MSMAHSTVKVTFLALIAGMKSPRLTRNRIQVFVYDEAATEAQVPVEIYCASSFREESYIAAQNKMSKFRSWMEAAK